MSFQPGDTAHDSSKRNTKAMAQATDLDPIATPADWRPGDRVIVSPGMSTDVANERFQNVVKVKPYLRYAVAPSS